MGRKKQNDADRIPLDGSRFLETPEFRIHYVSKGTGHPLILVHGGGNWSYSYRLNILPLSRHFSVYAPDIPGHGYSRVLSGRVTYNFGLVCDALVRFMDRIGMERAHFAGHSWGGGWLIAFADRFPDRVGKLVLIDSSGIRHRERLAWEMLKYPLIGELLAIMTTRGFVRRGLSDCFYDKRLATAKMTADVYAPFRDLTSRMAQVRFSRNLDWRITEEALLHLHVPALILWGKQDRYIPVRHGVLMNQMISASRLEIIDRCGHSPHEEHPARVNRMISDFLI